MIRLNAHHLQRINHATVLELANLRRQRRSRAPDDDQSGQQRHQLMEKRQLHHGGLQTDIGNAKAEQRQGDQQTERDANQIDQPEGLNRREIELLNNGSAQVKTARTE